MFVWASCLCMEVFSLLKGREQVGPGKTRKVMGSCLLVFGQVLLLSFSHAAVKGKSSHGRKLHWTSEISPGKVQ